MRRRKRATPSADKRRLMLLAKAVKNCEVFLPDAKKIFWHYRPHNQTQKKRVSLKNHSIPSADRQRLMHLSGHGQGKRHLMQLKTCHPHSQRSSDVRIASTGREKELRACVTTCMDLDDIGIQMIFAHMQKGEPMKIRVTEITTEIEATANEISASQTIAAKFATLLGNALDPYRAYGDEGEEEEES